MKAGFIARVAVVAALYAGITIALRPISYGPLFQVRVAEALTVLPFVSKPAVLGLFLGCLIANVFGGLGLLDIGFGSLATLVAAYLTSVTRSPLLAPLPPVAVNAAVVGWYLSMIAGVPAWMTAGYVALGQVISCYGLGLPLLRFLLSSPSFLGLLGGKDRT